MYVQVGISRPMPDAKTTWASTSSSHNVVWVEPACVEPVKTIPDKTHKRLLKESIEENGRVWGILASK